MKRTTAKTPYTPINIDAVTNYIAHDLARSDEEYQALPDIWLSILCDVFKDSDRLEPAIRSFSSKTMGRWCEGSGKLFASRAALYETQPLVFFDQLFTELEKPFLTQEDYIPFSEKQRTALIFYCPDGSLLGRAIRDFATPLGRSLILNTPIKFPALVKAYYEKPSIFLALTAYATQDSSYSIGPIIAAYDTRQLLSQHGITLKHFQRVHSMFPLIENFSAPDIAEVMHVCGVTPQKMTKVSRVELKDYLSYPRKQEVLFSPSFSPWHIMALALCDEKMMQTICDYHQYISPFTLSQIVTIYSINPQIMTCLNVNKPINHQVGLTLQCLSHTQLEEMLTSNVQKAMFEYSIPLLDIAIAYTAAPDALKDCTRHYNGSNFALKQLIAQSTSRSYRPVPPRPQSSDALADDKLAAFARLWGDESIKLFDNNPQMREAFLNPVTQKVMAQLKKASCNSFGFDDWHTIYNAKGYSDFLAYVSQLDDSNSTSTDKSPRVSSARNI